MLVAGLWSSAAWGQTLPEAVDRTEQQIEDRIGDEEAAEAARRSRPAEGAEVDYAAVLADPDNVELNYAYALGQIRRGDLLGASATLERILILAPDLPRVRALYALVLFRLDNLMEAERELHAVLALDPPADLRARVEGYLYEVALRRKRTRFGVLLNFGYQYDSNRNAAPSSGRLDTFLGPVSLPEASQEEDDHGVFALTRLDVEHDLGFQELHRAFGSVTLFHNEQFKLDELDLDSFAASGGIAFDLAPVTVTPSAGVSHLRLSGESYRTSYGGGLRMDYRVMAPLTVYLDGRGEQQDFDGVDDAPRAGDESGPEFSIGIGAELDLGQSMRLAGGYRYIHKEADEDFEAYDGHLIALTHTWLLGHGLFLLTEASAEFDDYEAPDLLVGPQEREDDIYRVRATFGLPLSLLLFGLELPAALAGTTVTATGEWYRQDSNITNYDFTNLRAGAAISNRWRF